MLYVERVLSGAIKFISLRAIQISVMIVPRGGEAVSHEAHNLGTWVQIPAPQQRIFVQKRAPAYERSFLLSRFNYLILNAAVYVFPSSSVINKLFDPILSLLVERLTIYCCAERS